LFFIFGGDNTNIVSFKEKIIIYDVIYVLMYQQRDKQD